jgi:hypothetical protein
VYKVPKTPAEDPLQIIDSTGNPAGAIKVRKTIVFDA